MLLQDTSGLLGLVNTNLRKFDILPPSELVLFVELRFTVPQEYYFVPGDISRPHFDINGSHVLLIIINF